MTQIELAPEIQEDFDRILDHLIEHEVGNVSQRVMEIIEAIDVLQHNLTSEGMLRGISRNWLLAEVVVAMSPCIPTWR